MALTREISVDKRRSSFDQDVLIDVESPDILLVDGPRVHVMVEIVEKMGQRQFKALSVAVLQGEFESHVRPSRANVTISGPERVLARLSKEDVVTFVDVKNLQPRTETYRLNVQVVFSREQYRRRLAVTKISDEVVSVRIYDRKLPEAEETAARGG